MCYGNLGQVQQAEAAGIPPSISGNGPDPETILGGAHDSQETTQLTGIASCYDLEGWQRADKKPFDAEARSAAMYGELSGILSMCIDSIITAK